MREKEKRERFRLIVDMRLKGKTYLAIGKKIGVSRQRVEQICVEYNINKPSIVVPVLVPDNYPKQRKLLQTHIVINEKTGCYEWTRALSKEGYARISMDCKPDYGHRVAYRLFKGEIPLGMHVYHSCDNPKCVNPDHLWLGSPRENMKDRDMKGRGRYGKLHIMK